MSMDKMPADRDVDDLNRYWDALVLGEPQPATSLPDGFAATVRALGGLTPAIRAMPETARQDAPVWSSNGSRPTVPVGLHHGRVSRLARRPLAALGMVALLAITVGSVLLTILPMRSSIGDDPDPGYVILAASQDRGQVTALNQLTLQDEPLGGVAAVGTPSFAPADLQERARTNATYWYAYRGGEALLRVDTSDNRRHIATRDGITGKRLAEIDIGTPVFALGLSDDGRYLVFTTFTEPPIEWFVVDPTDGRLIATMSSREQTVTYPWSAYLDPVGRRLYRLVPQEDGPRFTAQTARSPGPFSVVLVGYDITTGKEIGRLPLPHQRLGSWPTGERAPWGGAVQASWTSDLAVSGHGKRLALFDPRGERITLIDAGTLTIAEEITVDASIRSAMATPIKAATPASVGLRPYFKRGFFARFSWTAAFSVDGQSLYVAGLETALVAGQSAARDLGLHRIDLATGKVTASATGSATSGGVQVTSEAIYAYGPRLVDLGPNGLSEGSILRRLDPESLTERAARLQPAGAQFIILKR